MAPSRTIEAVPEPLYRSLVWLDVRLGLLFAVGLPLVLLIWAAIRREGALRRLLGLYWKVASLQVIALLLLTDHRALGLVLLVIAPQQSLPTSATPASVLASSQKPLSVMDVSMCCVTTQASTVAAPCSN